LAFTFRKLTSDHAIEWQTLKLEGVEDFPLGFLITPEEALKTTKDRARTHLNFGTTRGVFYHNTLVGFCGYRPELFERTRHRAQIGPFFVRSKYQGAGAAQCLMSGVIQEARAAKIAQLELFVDTENYRAIRFYEKYGFEWVATHPDGVRMGAQSRDDHFYCLRLGP
jgi:ribosomal protein S18 acetylase RimI-like enzyme